ncbi:hypothetical protein AALB81_15965 [Lachnospiraceae bacterium 48-33]
MHVADENAMKDSEKMLYDEFAYVLKIERSEIIPYITEQLETKYEVVKVYNVNSILLYAK